MKKIVHVIVIILLVWCCVVLAYRYFKLSLQTVFAEEQIKIFFLLEKEIFSSDINVNTALKFEAIINYYPSGTKQEKGSRLDSLVENTRKNIIADIIVFLKNKTGKDFGKNPQIWIEKIKCMNQPNQPKRQVIP